MVAGSPFSSARDTADARYDSMFLGEVTSNQDPEGLGRVRVLVPGLLEPQSVLAHPAFSMFGVKNGIHWVPEVGANVMVFLLQGHPDYPYYLPGPFGAPQGASDVPEQAPQGSVDHVVFRWRDFHFTFNGKANEEKVTLEDLVSGTRIVLDRPSGGDWIRDVEHDEIVAVKNDLSVTVEEGDETRTIATGERTTTIQGDDSKTLVAGDEVKTLTAGSKLQTLVAGSETKTLLAGSSTETMAAGAKTITALNVNVTGTAAVAVTAGGALTLTGGSVVLTSGGGASTYLSGGLLTRQFLGGILDTIVGGFVATISGVFSWTFNGIANFIGATLNLGLGTVGPPNVNQSVGYRLLVNKDIFTAYLNLHTHAALGTPPTQQIVPPTSPTQPIPDPLLPATSIDERLFSTAHVLGS